LEYFWKTMKLVLLPSSFPSSNKHGRKRPYTEQYNDLYGLVLRSYIAVSYTEKNGDLRRKKRSFAVFVFGLRLRLPGLFRLLYSIKMAKQICNHISKICLMILSHQTTVRFSVVFYLITNMSWIILCDEIDKFKNKQVSKVLRIDLRNFSYAFWNSNGFLIVSINFSPVRLLHRSMILDAGSGNFR